MGDTVFFSKAFTRFKRLAEQSRVLFVSSHADDILRQLCDKAIWLHHGNLMRYGQIEDVLAAYRRDVGAATLGSGEQVES